MSSVIGFYLARPMSTYDHPTCAPGSSPLNAGLGETHEPTTNANAPRGSRW